MRKKRKPATPSVVQKWAFDGWIDISEPLSPAAAAKRLAKEANAGKGGEFRVIRDYASRPIRSE